jgi:uncharacterized protein (DUF2267 family)
MTDSTDQRGTATAMTAPDSLVQRVVRWLRAGYPDGVPQQDYVALLGILRRALTSSEIERVVQELTAEAEAGMAIMTPQLVQQRITDVVKGPVHESDLVRVSARLAAAGWPLGSPADTGSNDGPDGADDLGRTGLVARVVDWLRADYPAGLPERDFIPLFALLRRRLSDDEVRMVARRLVEAGVLPSNRVDIGAAVAEVTTELPSEEDVQRVRSYLADHGWPLDTD